MTSLSLTTRPPAELAVDTLVVGSVRTPDGADLATGHHLPRKAVVHLQAVLSDVEATGKADEVVRVVAVPGVKATSVVVTGLGDGTSRRSSYPHAALRAAAGVALRSVRGKRTVARRPAHPRPREPVGRRRRRLRRLLHLRQGRAARRAARHRHPGQGGRQRQRPARHGRLGRRAGQGRQGCRRARRRARCGPRLGPRPGQHPAELPLPAVVRRQRQEAGRPPPPRR